MARAEGYRDEYIHELRRTLFKYFEENTAAVECVVSLYSMVRTAREAVVNPKPGADLAQGVMQMLVDFAYGLPGNPFWQQHSAQLWTVFAVSVNSWLDAAVFFDLEGEARPDDTEKQMELRMKGLSCMNALHQIASAALMLHAKPDQYRKLSADLFKDLTALKDRVPME